MPPTVLGLNFLSKEVETGPTATQFSPACAQTLSLSPREEAAKWAYPLFLPQKELFSSFCHRRNSFLVFAAELTFLLCGKTSCYAIKPSTVQ